MSTSVVKGNAVTADWLLEVLRSGGYDAGKADGGAVFGKHPIRPNVILKVHQELGLITIQHYWTLKTTLGNQEALAEALNRANSQSWRDTFFVDRQGDLAVSSYITLGEEMSASEIGNFLERESSGFTTAIRDSGLTRFIK
jgi:hypothetical protein